MKNLKNLLTALAFVFAIGAAFAFQPAPTMDQTVELNNGSCTEATDTEGCTSTAATVKCTIEHLGTPYEFYPDNQCGNTPTLGKP